MYALDEKYLEKNHDKTQSDTTLNRNLNKNYINYHLKKKFNKTVMIFFSVPSTGLLKGNLSCQYSDKFMPGIVLYCLHITILYKSNDDNKEQSKTMRNLPKP